MNFINQIDEQQVELFKKLGVKIISEEDAEKIKQAKEQQKELKVPIWLLEGLKIKEDLKRIIRIELTVENNNIETKIFREKHEDI